MPDYFDRLIGRSLATGDASGQAWVRPRLPQLFERPAVEVQETWAEPPAASPPPSAAVARPPATADRERVIVDHSRTAETVRETSVRETLRPTAAPPPEAPAPAEPRATRLERVVERQPPRPAARAPENPSVTEPRLERPLAARAVPALPVDPRPAAPIATPFATPETPAAPERTVRVSIGKLAVTAATPARATGGERPGRARPRVSLDRHLGREEGMA
ncbi:hypothetical protein ACFY36_10440 [Actinoplanes sp. NPDC000266]